MKSGMSMGIAARPPQARPQTGGPVMAQNPQQMQRQQQRQQYLQNHPNARGNQPQMGQQIANQAQPQPQRPLPPMGGQGQRLQQMPPNFQPQGGFQPMQMPGRGGMPMQGQYLGSMMGGGQGVSDMMYRYPPGQQPNFQGMQQGFISNEDSERMRPQYNEWLGQQQGQRATDAVAQQQPFNGRYPNAYWQKIRGGY